MMPNFGRFRLTLAALITTGLLSLPLVAEQAWLPHTATTPQPAAKSEAAKNPDDTAPKQVTPPGGLMVFIDPVTGKLRQPTPAEIAALSMQSAAPATAA